MHCRTCDYPLWNLPGRECPECGSSFKPSDFQFKPGAVKFCCLDCDQEYYGTSVQGHLIPKTFDCVGCGKHVDMDEMKLLPADGWDEGGTSALDAPWLRRNNGIVKRWFATVGWSYVKPIEMMRGVPSNSGTAPAWWFMVLTQAIAGVFGIGVPVLLIGVLITIGNSRAAGGTLGVSSLSIFVSLAGVIVFALIWGLLAHGTLVITGGCAHSIGRTMSAIFYASGTMAIQAVPCIGPYCFSYIVFIWWMVSAILMLAEAQKVSGARASLAVLWFPLGMILLVIAGYVVFIMAAVSQGTAMRAAIAAPTMTTQGELVVSSDLRTEWQRSGAWPLSLFDVVDAPGFGRGDRLEFFDLATNGNAIGVDLLPEMDGMDIGMLEGVPYQRRINELRALEVLHRNAEGLVDHIRFGAIV